MKETASLIMKSCPTCGLCNRPQFNNKAPLVPIRTGFFNEILHIDFGGPYKITPNGNRYLLIMIDNFTNWPNAIATKDATAQTTIEVIMQHWVCHFGMPFRIHSDRGSNFECETFQGVCQMLGIKKSRNTSFHPICNSKAERLIGSLKKMVEKLCLENKEPWDKTIHLALLAYRSCVQKSTKFSPHYLLFGRPMKLPIELQLGLIETERFTEDNYVINLQQMLLKTYEQVRLNYDATHE